MKRGSKTNAPEVERLALELRAARRQVEELERATRLKSDFMALMSHELRTPMHVIIGYNDLLLEGEFGPLSPGQVEAVAHMGERTRELLDLLTATFDLTQLESGGIPEDIDVVELVGEVAAEIFGLHPNPEIEFRCDAAPDLPRLRVDRLKITLILHHLLDNAVKFTDQGFVRVALAQRPEAMEISVADSGPGIEPELVAHLFEPFHPGRDSLESRARGIGLGLYTVRRVLDMVRGSIEVDSEPGGGSRFRVRVPPTS